MATISNNTVQAPHSPRLHATFNPVKASLLRKVKASVSEGDTSTSLVCPFIFNESKRSMTALEFVWAEAK